MVQDAEREEITDIDKTLDFLRTAVGYKRSDIKDLIQRYYEYLGYKIEFVGGLLQVLEPETNSVKFKYVFNRKAFTKHPKAELITYNNETLERIIEEISERGKAAKAFIPFQFDPNESFAQALSSMCKNNGIVVENFIENGSIASKGHFIGYVPFLVFLLKIQFNSIETYSFIEKPVVCLVDQKEKDFQINKERFIEKIKNYFDQPKQGLVTEMPVTGEILDIDKDYFVSSVNETLKKIDKYISKHRKIIQNRLKETLNKELNILNNYYDQRIAELEHRIDLAKERADMEDVEEYQNRIENIKEEKDFKINEYRGIYQIETVYDLLGAALIYVPSSFYYKCVINSEYGDISKNIYYDTFSQELITPRCDSCGKEITRGKICSSQHFSCLKCSQSCKTCGKELCLTCDIKFCYPCHAVLCLEHAISCQTCETIGTKRWVCGDHIYSCSVCDTINCKEHNVVCCVCSQNLCKENTDCRTYCPICKQYACQDHIFRCNYDDKIYCINEKRICKLCGLEYCRNHISLGGYCVTCTEATNDQYFDFIIKEKVEISIHEVMEKKPLKLLFKSPAEEKGIIYNYTNQNIRMGQNANMYVFILKKLSETHVLVHDKKNGKEVLYVKQNLLGKLWNSIRRKESETKMNIKKPILRIKK